MTCCETDDKEEKTSIMVISRLGHGTLKYKKNSRGEKRKNNSSISLISTGDTGDTADKTSMSFFFV